MSVAPSSDLLVIPAERLRVLLRHQQRRLGAQLQLLVGLSSEAAAMALAHPESIDDATLMHLAARLEAQAEPLLPTRHELTVDLDHRVLSAAGHEVQLGWRRNFETVVKRYLALVHDIRDLPAGTRFRPRNDDVQRLADALTIPFPVVRTQLWRAMDIDARTDHSAQAKVRRAITPVATIAAVGGSLYLVRQAISTATSPRATAANAGTTANPQPSAQIILPGEPADQVGVAPAAIVVEDVPTNNTVVAPPGSADISVPANPAQDPANSRSVAVPAPPVDVPIGDTPATVSLASAVGAEALGLINYDWQTNLATWTIEFHEGKSGLLGYAFFKEQRIEIYVRGSQTPYDVATVVAHELGHAVDVSTFGDSERNQWLDARGISESPWWPPNGDSDFASGAGDWAEAFASWLMADTNQSQLAGAHTAAQLDLVADLVRS